MTVEVDIEISDVIWQCSAGERAEILEALLDTINTKRGGDQLLDTLRKWMERNPTAEFNGATGATFTELEVARLLKEIWRNRIRLTPEQILKLGEVVQ